MMEHPEVRRRHGLLALAACVLWLGACHAENRAEVNDVYAAALRASRYLLGAAPEMDPAWRALSFARLYKIAPTEELANQFKSVFDDTISRPVGYVPDRLNSPRLLDTRALRPILVELWRRQMAGEPWQESAAALEALFAEHEAEFWSPIKATQQLVFLYLFGVNNIETKRSVRDVAKELRERWVTGDPEQLVFDIHFMYGVTHVVYVDSGYADRWLDPADYETEIEILETAIAHFAVDFPTDPTAIDLSFELIAARRFLQLPESGEARKLKDRLLLLQDESGSWRPGNRNNTVHATREAVHALGEFPQEFRRLEPAHSENK